MLIYCTEACWTCKPLALLSVREWNGDSFVLLTAVWIFISLSKDQRSKEAQVSLRLNVLLFRTSLNMRRPFIKSHNSQAEDRTVLTRFHCFYVKMQRKKFVKFVWLTLITIASSFFGVIKPFTENDVHVGVMHTENDYKIDLIQELN